MSDRVDIRVSEDAKEAFREQKRDGETWEGLVVRATEALAADENRSRAPGAPRCTDCGSIAEAWTVEDGMLVCGSCADANVPIR